MSGEDGFTLQEILVAIVVMGILLAIGIVIFLGILERWRVNAATNQLVADLRLAHTNASNELTDWRVVLMPERGEEGLEDYHLVKLKAPYPGSVPEIEKDLPRTFPGNVKVVNSSGSLDVDTETGWVKPPSAIGVTRTLEFNSDGTMRFYQAVSGSTCVTVDGNPQNRVVVLAATSRVKVKDGAC